MRRGGLEPPSLSAPDPKSGASASSATLADERKIRDWFLERETQNEACRQRGILHVGAFAFVLRGENPFGPDARTDQKPLASSQEPVVVQQDADGRRRKRLRRVPDDVAIPRELARRPDGESAQHDVARVIPKLEFARRVARMVDVDVRADAAERDARGHGVLDLEREDV